MRLPVLTLLSVAALAASSAPTASAAAGDASGPTVPILTAGYGSPRIDILTGDSVTWRNTSFRIHSVTANDGTWSSERLPSSVGFTRRFDAPGAVSYYCQLHPFMHGEVDVHRLLLSAPRDSAATGRPFVLDGRATLPAGSTVSIRADGATQPSATATVESNGGFRATVTPRATASYRAVAGDESSPPVQVLVLDQKLVASTRTDGRHVLVNARSMPGAPGTTAVLQLRLREHFGWWPVQRTRLDRGSRARFKLALRRSVRARVLLTAADGATELARSATLRLRPHR